MKNRDYKNKKQINMSIHKALKEALKLEAALNNVYIQDQVSCIFIEALKNSKHQAVVNKINEIKE